jgi:hypothetical protein
VSGPYSAPTRAPLASSTVRRSRRSWAPLPLASPVGRHARDLWELAGGVTVVAGGDSRGGVSATGWESSRSRRGRRGGTSAGQGELVPALSAMDRAANGLRGERRHICGSRFAGQAKCIPHLGIPLESVLGMQKHCDDSFLSLGHLVGVSQTSNQTDQTLKVESLKNIFAKKQPASRTTRHKNIQIWGPTL